MKTLHGVLVCYRYSLFEGVNGEFVPVKVALCPCAGLRTSLLWLFLLLY